MILLRRLIRIGSSRGVVLPPQVIDALKLQSGDHVAIAVEDGRVVIRRISTEELMGRPLVPPPATAAQRRPE